MTRSYTAYIEWDKESGMYIGKISKTFLFFLVFHKLR